MGLKRRRSVSPNSSVREGVSNYSNARYRYLPTSNSSGSKVRLTEATQEEIDREKEKNKAENKKKRAEFVNLVLKVTEIRKQAETLANLAAEKQKAAENKALADRAKLQVITDQHDDLAKTLEKVKLQCDDDERALREVDEQEAVKKHKANKRI